MADWFTLDGQNCVDIGVHVKAFPPRMIPKRSGVEAKIPGGAPLHSFDGAWGYENMMAPLEVYVDMTAGFDSVAAFFMPAERRIVFGDDPAFEHRGRCEDQADFEKIMRGRKPRGATVNFILSPFKRLSSPGDPFIFTSGGSIFHPGTARCFPLFKIEGEGNGSFTLGQTRETAVYDLEPEKPLIIDSEAMICTDEKGYQNRSMDMGGPYPYLDPGTTSLSLSGGITKITIEPRFLWLGR